MKETRQHLGELSLEPELARAARVLEGALDTCEHLLDIYKGTRGRPRSERHDVLRATLIYACSGLEATLRQGIKDCSRVIACGSGHAASLDSSGLLQSFAQRELVDKEKNLDTALVAELLLSDSPVDVILERFIKSLADSGSLQSFEELVRVFKELKLDKNKCVRRKEPLISAFRARNEIVHTMDVEFPERRGQPFRRLRKRDDIVAHSRTVLEMGYITIRELNQKVKEAKETTWVSEIGP